MSSMERGLIELYIWISHFKDIIGENIQMKVLWERNLLHY